MRYRPRQLSLNAIAGLVAAGLLTIRQRPDGGEDYVLAPEVPDTLGTRSTVAQSSVHVPLEVGRRLLAVLEVA